MKAFTETTLILGFVLINCASASISSSTGRPPRRRFGRRSFLNGNGNENAPEQQMAAVDAAATTTAMRPLSPSRISSPIPMPSTGLNEVEEDTTTPTTDHGVNHDNNTDHDQPSSVWSRWQKRLPIPLQSRQGSSFDMVPLPRQRRKRSASSSSFQQQSKQSRSSKNSKSGSGTRFDLRPPSPERLSKWFGSTASDGKQRRSRKTVTQLFNHDSVGMTNPVLHISLDQQDDQDNQYLGVDYDQSSSSASVSLASSATPARQQPQFELQDSWIPASTTTHPQQQSTAQNNNGWAHVLQYKLKAPPAERSGAERAWFPSAPSPQQQKQQQQKRWRQCRYRRRVGQGQACYERVRDAALAWQFNHTEHPTQGILPVHATDSQQKPRRKSDDSKSNNIDCFQLDDRTSKHVLPIWSGPHTEGSRRLVTFTSTGFKTKWLPKLYTMNPVMVVYDLLDQRGPETTYSSTAYATLKGHLLRGEERVTVAMRDDTGFVDVEILSFSRPAGSLKSKFVWPLIGNMQDTFFQNQMNFLEQIAVPAPPSSSIAESAQ